MHVVQAIIWIDQVNNHNYVYGDIVTGASPSNCGTKMDGSPYQC